MNQDDAVIPEKQIQSNLSMAYIEAITAFAGYTVSKSFDDYDSVDLIIAAGGDIRPRVEIQLKATINLKGDEQNFKFPLTIKNYNDLRGSNQTPRILVVLDMPKESGSWLTHSKDALILQKSAYWVSIKGLPETQNSVNVTIDIPKSQKFDTMGLKRIMEESRKGRI